MNVLFNNWIHFFFSKKMSEASLKLLTLAIIVQNQFYLTRLPKERWNCAWNVLSKHWCIEKLNVCLFSAIHVAEIFYIAKRSYYSFLNLFTDCKNSKKDREKAV